MSEFHVVLVSCKDPKEAETIAQGAVEGKLAACVNILPGAQSIYRWEGKVEKASEVLLLIKSRVSAFDQLQAFIKANHSYSCPEIISLPISQGSKPYLDWIKESVS